MNMPTVFPTLMCENDYWFYFQLFISVICQRTSYDNSLMYRKNVICVVGGF